MGGGVKKKKESRKQGNELETSCKKRRRTNKLVFRRWERVEKRLKQWLEKWQRQLGKHKKEKWKS